jgi:hypothetical protein
MVRRIKGRTTHARDDDLRAFEAAQREAVAAGINQQTPVDPPGLIELLQRAGVPETSSNSSREDHPTNPLGTDSQESGRQTTRSRLTR